MNVMSFRIVSPWPWSVYKWMYRHTEVQFCWCTLQSPCPPSIAGYIGLSLLCMLVSFWRLWRWLPFLPLLLRSHCRPLPAALGTHSCLWPLTQGANLSLMAKQCKAALCLHLLPLFSYSLIDFMFNVPFALWVNISNPWIFLVWISLFRYKLFRFCLTLL